MFDKQQGVDPLAALALSDEALLEREGFREGHAPEIENLQRPAGRIALATR
jgi:hypothetical protein